jgi:H+/Cl- antiporter ClcA
MPKIFKILSISLFVGTLSGTLSSLFLLSLTQVTSFRQTNPYLIWALPVFGFFFALLIKKIPHHINQGVPYILEELENEKAHVSPWMVPFIFLGSLGTHLFGGSAGREGVGVIMGASAAHLMPKIRETYKEMRPFLIYSGIAAGFSSIFGTPLAAIIFSFELHSFKHVRRIEIVICTILASFVALLVPHLLDTPHQYFHVSYTLEGRLFYYVSIASIASGIGGQLFYWGLKGYTNLISYMFPSIELKLLMGGLFVSFLVFFTDSYQYIGIGTDVIARSFIEQMSSHDFVLKCLLTIMTISIGFKGGEVTPLFFMGATFSNSIASLFNLKNFALSSSLGMVGLFGAVTGTPLASAVMGGELFGWKVGVLCLITCYFSRFLMGNRTVYRH